MPGPSAFHVATLRRAVAAWQARRNQAKTLINWRFATADARVKLHRLYPAMDEQEQPPVIELEQAISFPTVLPLTCQNLCGRPLAYEAQVPEVAETKIEGLQRFYGINETQGLAFFQVHRQADRFHADTSRQILREHLTPAEAKALVPTCEQALDALWGMLDGVYAHYC